jgi:hypothetical protein
MNWTKTDADSDREIQQINENFEELDDRLNILVNKKGSYLPEFLL